MKPPCKVCKPKTGSWLRRRYTAWRESFVYRSEVRGHHGPIGIVHTSLREDSADFVAIAEKALLLIGSAHPRGYRRIKRELRYIANIPILSLGMYDPPVRACKIDFELFKRYVINQNDSWTVAYFACILIHEATHGHLHSRGVPYDVNTRIRVERLCVREEERFAARLRSDAYDSRTLVQPFDESHWEDSWNRTRWQSAKLITLRLVKDIRETSKNRK